MVHARGSSNSSQAVRLAAQQAATAHERAIVPRSVGVGLAGRWETDVVAMRQFGAGRRVQGPRMK
jgi:hypothetical protein